MSERSDDVAAELMEIWVAGAVKLPWVAQVYGTGTTEAADAGGDSGKAFDRTVVDVEFKDFWPTFSTHTDAGEVAPQWAALAEVLNRCLSKSAEHFTRAGSALMQAVSYYEGAEADSRAKFEELKRERAGDPSLEQPPTA